MCCFDKIQYTSTICFMIPINIMASDKSHMSHVTTHNTCRHYNRWILVVKIRLLVLVLVSYRYWYGICWRGITASQNQIIMSTVSLVYGPWHTTAFSIHFVHGQWHWIVMLCKLQNGDWKHRIAFHINWRLCLLLHCLGDTNSKLKSHGKYGLVEKACKHDWNVQRLLEASPASPECLPGLTGWCTSTSGWFGNNSTASQAQTLLKCPCKMLGSTDTDTCPTALVSSRPVKLSNPIYHYQSIYSHSNSMVGFPLF